MSHTRIQSDLSAYLEGDLPPVVHRAVSAHLAQCDVCARELDAMRRTIDLLRGLPTPLPPPGLAESVMRRVQRGEGRRGWLPVFGNPLAGLFPAVAVPATAVLALALVVSAVGTPDLPFRISTLWGTGTASHSPQPAANTSDAEPAGSQVSRLAAPAPTPLRIGEATRLQPVPMAAGRASLAAESTRLIPVASSAPDSFRGGVPQSAAAWGLDFRLHTETAPNAALDDPMAKALRRRYELDRRLNFLLLSPESFANEFRTQSIAAQELWMAELVERAVERDVADEVLRSLQSSRGRDGQKLAQLFATSVDHLSQRVRAARD